MKKLALPALVAVLLTSACAGSPANQIEEIESTAKPIGSEISLENLVPGETEAMAFHLTIDYLKSKSNLDIKPNIVASENVSQDEIKLEIELISDTVRLFQDYFLPEKFTVVMFTREDGEWANDKFEEIGGDYPSRLSTQISSVPAEYYCGFAFATTDLNGEPVYYTCSGSEGQRDWPYRQTPPHEYFHLVQFALTNKEMPAWLIEGSAAFFGEVIGYKELETPLTLRLQQNFNTSYGFDPDREGFDWPRFQKWATGAKSQDVIDMYERLEGGPTMEMERYAYYTLGSWATEALVASFGFEQFMKIWTAIEETGSFEAGFRQTFGLEPKDFYAKLTPLINSKLDPGLE